MVSERYEIWDESAQCHKLVLTSDIGTETVFLIESCMNMRTSFINEITSKRENQ